MSNLLSEMRPELVSEWSDKNLPLTPDKITYGSNKVVWWKGACGHEWQTSVKARSSGENCPICSGARVIEGINDLATLKPELADEWSSKNNPLKPTMITIGSHKKVIWQDKYGHEWTATVKSRALNGTGCPYCAHNKVFEGFNDLATLFPEIAAEWSERNLPLLPTMVVCDKEYDRVFPALTVGYYASLKGLKVQLGSDKLLGITLEAYLPSEKLAIEWTSGTEQMEILKVHLCRQRQIKLIKLPYEKQEDKKEYADKVKAVLRRQHIFISTNTEQDIAVIQKRFMEWRKNR